MIDINRRKYLTELGKLLTFMYEEDRQEALALYEQLFDDAEDETALMEFLGSPTKQAVAVAHAYNAKDRKLAVTSQEGAEYADVSGKEIPPFVEAINGFYKKAAESGIVRSEEYTVPEDLFEEEPAEPVGEDISGDEAPAEEKDAAAEETGDFPAVEELTEEVPEEAAAFMASVSAEEELQALFAPPAEPAQEEVPEETVPEEEAEELPAENIMLDLGPIPEPERSNPDQINEVMAAFREKEEKEASVPDEAEQTSLSEFDNLTLEEATPWKRIPPEQASEGRINVPITILYLIASVPLTAAGVLILLVPTLLFFVLSAGSGILAFYTASSAFGNFAVFADIMVVLGAALVLGALALFFFFIFLWFIVSAIAGLINLSIRLGGKICFMEGKQA